MREVGDAADVSDRMQAGDELQQEPRPDDETRGKPREEDDDEDADARPWIEDDQRWITTGDDMDTDEALRMACREMVALLMRRLKIPFEEAYMLASIRADLGVCQACDPGRFPVTTRMSYDSRVKNDA